MIVGIRDDQGAWRAQPDEVASVLTKYYQELFTITRPDVFIGVLAHIPYVIIDEMNLSLSREFTQCEVCTALKQMAQLKALGPDGMPPLFYLHFLSAMDSDVTSSILSWLNSGTLPHPLNHTFITLIPKTNNPKYVMCCIKLFQKF